MATVYAVLATSLCPCSALCSLLYSPCSCTCRDLRVQYNLESVADALAETVPHVSQFSRGLVGRMMADPAFLQKLAMEQAITISSSLWWEAQQRGDRFSKVRLLPALVNMPASIRFPALTVRTPKLSACRLAIFRGTTRHNRVRHANDLGGGTRMLVRFVSLKALVCRL